MTWDPEHLDPFPEPRELNANEIKRVNRWWKQRQADFASLLEDDPDNVRQQDIAFEYLWNQAPLDMPEIDADALQDHLWNQKEHLIEVARV